MQYLKVSFYEIFSFSFRSHFFADRGNALSHLNKGRAKPKGRRPPSRAAGLAHLTTEEVPIHVDEPDEPQKIEKKDSPKLEKKALTPDAKKLPLKPSPKPRPKSMQ